MKYRGWLGVLAALHACQGGPPSGRQTVEVTLPLGGLETGGDRTGFVLIEFGSFACHYCQLFHDSVYPGVAARFVGPGRARFRFVSVDTAPPLLRIAAWAQCAVAGLGVDSALAFAFDLVRDGKPPPGPEDPDSCEVRSLATRRQEAEAAQALGVRAVPTFVVGVQDFSGRLVGWVVQGLDEDALWKASPRCGASPRGPRPAGGSWLATAQGMSASGSGHDSDRRRQDGSIMSRASFWAALSLALMAAVPIASTGGGGAPHAGGRGARFDCWRYNIFPEAGGVLIEGVATLVRWEPG
jgi:hypothetical protein